MVSDYSREVARLNGRCKVNSLWVTLVSTRTRQIIHVVGFVRKEFLFTAKREEVNFYKGDVCERKKEMLITQTILLFK